MIKIKKELMKQNRIELRASEGEHARFMEAATFTGVTLSAFLRQAAREKSDNVLKNKDNLTLSDKDRDLFLKALENPPRPNKRLQKAFITYRKLKKSARENSFVKKIKSSKKNEN
jgi:uncharacterized protein (DUF1778 family)